MNRLRFKFGFTRDMLKASPYIVFNQLWAKFAPKHEWMLIFHE